jgi:hypothetical protein
MIAQIYEQQTAMIAHPVNPARQPDLVANIFIAQLAAIMGAIFMGHFHTPSEAGLLRQ